MNSWQCICVVVVGVHVVIGYDGLTLTPVSIRPTTSAKPTTIYGRTNVERIEEISSTPLDLFKLTDHELRRMYGESSIWDWDYWCQLQPQLGNCTKSNPRFYYDAQLDQCVMFTYTGCNGNKNNFDTMTNCERHCKGSTYMPLSDSGHKTFCGLQPNSGLCMALYPKFYYDINDGTCKSFVYGGCGGNQNRFDNIAECVGSCLGETYLRSDLA